MTLLLLYTQLFSRIVMVVVFSLSFWGKFRNISEFEQTITRFQMLPSRLSRVAAVLFLGGELAVVMLMFLGGNWLVRGFLLAAVLLVAFSIALGWVLLRKIQTSCNCFGTSKKLVSPYDIVRNLGLIACALVGWGTLPAYIPVHLEIAEASLTTIMALVFVAVWLQVGEIVQLVRGI